MQNETYCNHIQHNQCYLLQVHVIFQFESMDAMLITTSSNSGITQHRQCWIIVKFSITIGITYQTIIIHYSHASTHLDHPNWLLPSHFVGLKLVAWAHGQMIEKMKMTPKKTCQLNLCPIIKHVNYKPQFLVWPFLSDTFTNLISSSTPSIQLNHLPQDGFMKLCND
jgi:hypothetical protein